MVKWSINDLKSDPSTQPSIVWWCIVTYSCLFELLRLEICVCKYKIDGVFEDCVGERNIRICQRGEERDVEIQSAYLPIWIQACSSLFSRFPFWRLSLDFQFLSVFWINAYIYIYCLLLDCMSMYQQANVLKFRAPARVTVSTHYICMLWTYIICVTFFFFFFRCLLCFFFFYFLSPFSFSCLIAFEQPKIIRGVNKRKKEDTKERRKKKHFSKHAKLAASARAQFICTKPV